MAEQEDYNTKVSSKDYRNMLNNLNNVNASDSESDLETEFSQKMSVEPGKFGMSKSKEWWEELKSSLARETEKQFLEVSPAPKVSSARFKKDKKTRSWAESRETIVMRMSGGGPPPVAPIRDSANSRGSTDSTSEEPAAPGGWWESMKQALDKDSGSLDKDSTSPPVTPSTSEGSGSWWDNLKADLDKTETAPVITVNKTPTVSRQNSGVMDEIHSSTSSGSWWGNLKDNLDRETGSIPSTPRRLSVESRGTETPTASQAPSTGDWWASLTQTLEKETETGSMASTPNTSANVSPTNSPLRAEAHATHNLRTSSRSRSGSIPPAWGTPVGHSDEGGNQVLKIYNGLYRGETLVAPDQNAVAHGNGIFTASNGELYIGQWHNGKRHGKGLRTWKDDKEYNGHWDNNKRTGAGMMSWGNGETYIGESQYGFQQGNGMMTFANGDKYIGEWHVSEREGYGVMIYKNGETYYGEWKHNKRDGFGIYKYTDGRVKEGLWKEGKFAGTKRNSVSSNN